MESLQITTSESLIFDTIDEMFEQCEYQKGVIPAAAIKIIASGANNNQYIPYTNAYDAIRTALHLKNVAGKRVSLALYIPDFTNEGKISITTKIYE